MFFIGINSDVFYTINDSNDAAASSARFLPRSESAQVSRAAKFLRLSHLFGRFLGTAQQPIEQTLPDPDDDDQVDTLCDSLDCQKPLQCLTRACINATDPLPAGDAALLRPGHFRCYSWFDVEFYNIEIHPILNLTRVNTWWTHRWFRYCMVGYAAGCAVWSQLLFTQASQVCFTIAVAFFILAILTRTDRTILKMLFLNECNGEFLYLVGCLLLYFVLANVETANNVAQLQFESTTTGLPVEFKKISDYINEVLWLFISLMMICADALIIKNHTKTGVLGVYILLSSTTMYKYVNTWKVAGSPRPCNSAACTRRYHISRGLSCSRKFECVFNSHHISCSRPIISWRTDDNVSSGYSHNLLVNMRCFLHSSRRVMHPTAH